jgi:hypothetical protein
VENPPDDDLTPAEEAELAALEAVAGQPFWSRYRVPLVVAVIGVAVAIGVLTGRAVTSDGEARAGSVISGTITVQTDPEDAAFTDGLQRTRSNFALGAPCDGGSVADGYGDIGPGTGVTVKNETGEIIATGSVARGRWVARACRLTFETDDVPEARFYEVEVGRRGAQRYSRAQLEDQNFEVDLVIGG